MKIKFTKMQGAGNDYIYVDTLKYPILNPERFAVEWSCPHTGIGSDGLVLIGPSDKADFSMRIFNADGSVSGGPMFYIAHGLTRKGLRWLGQPLALIFALIHFSIFQTVYQFLIGVVLALLVHFTGSIVFGMVFHFFNNFIILFISYFTQGNKSIFEFSNFGGLEIFLSILIFVLGVLVCVGIFYIIRKISRNTKNNEESLNTKQESSQIDTTNYILLGVGLFIAIFIWCVNSFGG